MNIIKKGCNSILDLIRENDEIVLPGALTLHVG